MTAGVSLVVYETLKSRLFALGVIAVEPSASLGAVCVYAIVQKLGLTVNAGTVTLVAESPIVYATLVGDAVEAATVGGSHTSTTFWVTVKLSLLKFTVVEPSPVDMAIVKT